MSLLGVVMNPVVQAQLKAFQSANPNTGFSDDKLFEVFSIYAIANGVLADNIDPFAAHLQGDEFGLDGVAIVVQGELCVDSDDVAALLSVGKSHEVEFNLFQAKTSEKLNYGDMSKFFDAAYAFFDDDADGETDQLEDLIAAKDAVYEAALKRNPTLRLFYVATGAGEVSPQIAKLVEATKARFGELNIFEAVEISVVGAKELQEGYRSATNSISAKIEINKPITLPEHPSVKQAFLGYVGASELVQLVSLPTPVGAERRVNKAVFYDNIRDFNPKSEINVGILNEIKSGAQTSFVFKNNGVTVVAKEVSRKGDVFELQDFQIVNGCQTSNILFLAGDSVAGIHVPFRLVESADPEFVATIIVGTNKQNEVKDDQFWALTPFMKDLEEYCRAQPGDGRIFVERRENQYRAEAVERTRICRPSDLVKAIAAMFLFKPHRSARDYRGVRQEFASKLFQKTHSVIPYHAAAFAAYRADWAVRNKRVQAGWGIYKYYVLAAAGHLATQGKDVFSMSKKDMEKACAAINATFADESKLVEHFERVAGILDKLVEDQKLTAREKIRDFIRRETVTDQFFAAFAKE
jgi:hypothetical protein